MLFQVFIILPIVCKNHKLSATTWKQQTHTHTEGSKGVQVRPARTCVLSGNKFAMNLSLSVSLSAIRSLARPPGRCAPNRDKDRAFES